MYPYRRGPRLWALILVVIGSALLLANLGVISSIHFKEWWPVLLILVGLRALFWPRSWRRCERREEEAAVIIKT